MRVGFSPVTVNPKARAYPRGLSLRMDCGGEPLRADAYNYQGTALFDWSPEQCGNLTLAILFDGFTAEKVYDKMCIRDSARGARVLPAPYGA